MAGGPYCRRDSRDTGIGRGGVDRDGALGASPSELFRHVVGRGTVLSAIGIVAGLAASAAATGVLRSLLFGVEPWDPVTFLAATGLLAVVTITASWLPARRAQRTDPLVVLRAE